MGPPSQLGIPLLPVDKAAKSRTSPKVCGGLSKSYLLLYGRFARFLPSFPAQPEKRDPILHIMQEWYRSCWG
jgi:hypothetical protein